MAEALSSEIARAAQEAQNWIGELMRELHCDERKAYILLKAVLHGLRDRLSVEEIAALATYLPTFIRGLFLEDWRPGFVSSSRYAEGVLEICLSAGVVDQLEVDVAISAAADLLDRRITQARRAAWSAPAAGVHS
jgi:uncharacterized protein (DUF2267 family)